MAILPAASISRPSDPVRTASAFPVLLLWAGKRFLSPDGHSWLAIYRAAAQDEPAADHMRSVIFAKDETITYLRGERTWFAVAGFKGSYWLVVAALVGHGVFDFVRHFFIDNPGVPQWWPGFCLASDVVFGAWVAVLIITRRQPSVNRSTV